jgi:hypoxanthine phosphoribosyltransferase
MQEITLHNKAFRLHIDNATIERRIRSLSKQINKDYKDKLPLFIGVLNGAFMFAGELMKNINLTCEITFVKMQSYEGMTNNDVKSVIGLDKDVKGRDIIIVEDIIDSGNTLNALLEQVNKWQPASVGIVALLFKPEALKHNIKISYIGFEIPKQFVAGYGLDYDGLGRNLTGIYQLIE